MLPSGPVGTDRPRRGRRVAARPPVGVPIRVRPVPARSGASDQHREPDGNRRDGDEKRGP